MKKHLLSLAMLAGLAITASADEFYVIKDGKFVDGVEVLEYAKPTDGPKVEETTAPDAAASPAVAITHQAYCTEARFYVANGIDLTKTWNIEIEYYYEAVDSALHAGANKWEVINFGLHADTTFATVDPVTKKDTIVGRYTLEGVISDNTFNVKEKTRPNVWNVEKQFVYAPANIDIVKEIVFGWQRQIKEEDAIAAAKPVYIKNLKFVGEGNKPFFYEDFDAMAFGTHYSNGADGVNYYVITDEGVTEYKNSTVLASSLNANPFKCQLNWYTVQDMSVKFSQKQVSLSLTRMFEPTGSDGSEYYDTELLHSLCLTRPTGTGTRSASGLNGRSFVLIPTCGLEGTTEISMDFLSKWNASQAENGEVFAESADSLVLPIKYAYVDDAVEASTCELTLLTEEPMASIWTAYSAKIPFVGGKKYLALVFDKAEFLSYVVDNIRLTSDALPYTKVDTPVYPAIFDCYYASVENVDADNATAIVSPVPATDVITVNNEGVESVEVLNTLGAVVAYAVGSEVNVANLPAGLYVVKGNTANGVVTAKIIKK